MQPQKFDPIVKVLTNAKAVLLTRGWCQNRAVNDKGNVCLAEALAIACEDSPDQEKLFVEVSEVMCQFMNKRYITDWNDQEGRTKENVLEALDKAIAVKAK